MNSGFKSMSDDPDEPVGPQNVSRQNDVRLYIPDDHWEARTRRAGEQMYCFGKFEGEDWHHQIVTGELFLQRGSEVLCLSCAMKHGVVTTDRVFWQHLAKDPNRRPIV